jgi:hypothetical protein
VRQLRATQTPHRRKVFGTSSARRSLLFHTLSRKLAALLRLLDPAGDRRLSVNSLQYRLVSLVVFVSRARDQMPVPLHARRRVPAS